MMYREYYHFSEDPFDLRPDPKFLYLARSHWEVLSTMMSGIKERKGMIVITGEAGIGKTILIHALLKDLNEKIKTAFIFNPTLDLPSMLETILRELKVPVPPIERDVRLLLVAFRKYLNQRFTQGEIVTVIIDEAQGLQDEVLESLFRLSDPETPAAKSLQILLLGHPELDRRLKSQKLEILHREVAVSDQIKPLTREEGRGYIHYRLKLVGRDSSEIFTDRAVNQIWKYAKGIPRVMNLICDRSLFIGYEQSRPIIDSKIVRQAIADFEEHAEEEKEATPLPHFGRSARYVAIRIAIFLLSLGIFFLTLKKILPLLMG
jgi:general secretion pathway protein A